ncbi:MAG: hypothetical protein J6M66_02310 [Lachnospiraceae bacterium]|nr:hypothetical protein [Lachnospiraceae bacterium]
MKEILRKLLLALLGIGFIAYLLVTAIGDLTNTKDVHSIRADGAVQLLQVEHSINGLIPVGKDHYYFAMNETTNEACVVKASPKWYKKNFDETTGYALNTGGVVITALSKRETDFEIRDELISRASQVDGVQYITAPGYAMELDYKVRAFEKLALLVVFCVVVAWGVVIVKRGKPVGDKAGKVYLVFAIVLLILILKVII